MKQPHMNQIHRCANNRLFQLELHLIIYSMEQRRDYSNFWQPKSILLE